VRFVLYSLRDTFETGALPNGVRGVRWIGLNIVMYRGYDMRDTILKVDELLLEQQSQYQSIVLDGAVDLEQYLAARPRILWILRETNGDVQDLRQFLREQDKQPGQRFGYNRWQATYGLVVKVSYGLLNGCKPWGDWANDAPSIAACLRNVAVININKRGGGSRVNWKRLYQASLDFGEIVCQQVEALDPQIVILGGTWHILPNALKTRLSDLDNNSDSDFASVAVEGTTYVRAYHPSQTRIRHETYYNRIRDCVANVCVPSCPRDA